MRRCACAMRKCTEAGGGYVGLFCAGSDSFDEELLGRRYVCDYHVDPVLAGGIVEGKGDLKLGLCTAVKPKRPASVNEMETKSWSNADVARSLLIPFSFYEYYGFKASVQPLRGIMGIFNHTHVRAVANGGTTPAIALESGTALIHNITAAWKVMLEGIAEIDHEDVPECDGLVGEYHSISQYRAEYD